MTRNRIYLALAGVLLIACAVSAGNDPLILFELRVPKKIPVDPTVQIYFAAPRETDQAALSETSQRIEGDYAIFQKSFRVMKGSKHGLIVHAGAGADQVFRLPIPQGARQPDWTPWRRPNYIETNALWHYVNYVKSRERSTNVPPDSFELRYKLE